MAKPGPAPLPRDGGAPQSRVNKIYPKKEIETIVCLICLTFLVFFFLASIDVGARTSSIAKRRSLNNSIKSSINENCTCKFFQFIFPRFLFVFDLNFFFFFCLKAPLPRDPIPMDIPEAPPLPDNFNLPKGKNNFKKK